MAGFGDFGSEVGRWAAETGETFNEEWYGANPSEYAARMRRQAQSYWSGKAKEQAEREANELRERLNREREEAQQRFNQRNQEFRNFAQAQAERSQAYMDVLIRQNQQTRQAYDRQLQQQRQLAQQAEQRRQAEAQRRQQERQAREQRRGQVSNVRQSYLDTLNNVFSNQQDSVGGRYSDQLSQVLSNYRTGLDAYAGSDNVQGAQAAAEGLGGQYRQQVQDIQRSYQQTVDESRRRISQARQQADTRGGQFRQSVRQSMQALTPATSGLQATGTGLLSAAQTFEGLQRGALEQGIGQSQQVRQGQEQTFSALEQGALSPDTGYEQRRDQQLADSQRYGFLSNIYNPNFVGLQGSYTSLNPLIEQATQTYQKTYGYDQEKAQSFINPIQQQQQQVLAQLQGQYQGFQQGLGGLLSNVGSGMFSGSEVAARQARMNNVNQQLRGFEQQMQGLLSNYYNVFSDFATRAENEFNEQKAFRINEKQNILGGMEAAEVDKNIAQARGRAERGRVQQLLPVAGLYNTSNLLSSLSRGNV